MRRPNRVPTAAVVPHQVVRVAAAVLVHDKALRARALRVLDPGPVRLPEVRLRPADHRIVLAGSPVRTVRIERAPLFL